MNKLTRIHYFTKAWPQACETQGWDPTDEKKRHLVTRQCMLLCGGPDTDSTILFGQAEISALFTYLRWLAFPNDPRKCAAWAACQVDYRTRNVAAQGDYWRRKAGYDKGGRVDRDRFGGKSVAGQCRESTMTKREADDYLMTMRARANAKRRKSKYDVFKEEPGEDEIPF